MKLHRYVDHQRLHIVTKDVISLSISVLLLFRHYISHKISFGASSSGGVLRSACGAFMFKYVLIDFHYILIILLSHQFCLQHLFYEFSIWEYMNKICSHTRLGFLLFLPM